MNLVYFISYIQAVGSRHSNVLTASKSLWPKDPVEAIWRLTAINVPWSRLLQPFCSRREAHKCKPQLQLQCSHHSSTQILHAASCPWLFHSQTHDRNCWHCLHPGRNSWHCLHPALTVHRQLQPRCSSWKTLRTPHHLFSSAAVVVWQKRSHRLHVSSRNVEPIKEAASPCMYMCCVLLSRVHKCIENFLAS